MLSIKFTDDAVDAQFREKAAYLSTINLEEKEEEELRQLEEKWEKLREVCLCTDNEERMGLCMALDAEWGRAIVTAIMMKSFSCQQASVAEETEEIIGGSVDEEESHTDGATAASSFARDFPSEGQALKEETQTDDEEKDDEDEDEDENDIPEGYVRPEGDALRALTGKITCEQNEKKAETPLSFKEFKRDCDKKITYHGLYVLFLMSMHQFFSDELMAHVKDIARNDNEHSGIKFGLQQLLGQGYLGNCRIDSLQGNYYRLTARGLSVFKHEKAVNIIRAHKEDVKKLFQKTYDGAGDIMPFFVVRCRLILESFSIRGRYAAEVCVEGAYCFEFIHAQETGIASHGFIALNSDSEELFICAHKWLAATFASLTSLTVVGIDASHAKAMAGWIMKIFPAVADKDFFYAYLDDNKLYRVSDDSEVSKAEFKHSKNNDSGQTVPDESEDVLLPQTTPTEPEDVLPPQAVLNESEESDDAQEESDLPDSSAEAETNSILPVMSVAPVKETEAGRDIVRELGFVATLPEDIAILPTADELLAKGKFYCAAAFLRKASQLDAQYAFNYRQLAYALNDPMEQCAYSARQTIAVFTADESRSFNSYYFVAAILRTLFYNAVQYDFEINNMYALISHDEVMSNYPVWNNIMYEIKGFRERHGYGIDMAADYRKQDALVVEKKLNALVGKAAANFQRFNGGQMGIDWFAKRHHETYKIIFGAGNNLMTYLEFMSHQSIDDCIMREMKEFLAEHFIKEGLEISADNIDGNKIDKVIDEAWEEAGVAEKRHKKAPLSGKARGNLEHHIEDIVEIMCDYAVLAGEATDVSSADAGDYRKTRGKLLELFAEARRAGKADTEDTAVKAGVAVVNYTLEELMKRLDGTYVDYAHKYFYVDFLRFDKILLDEHFSPVLLDVAGLPELSALNRIVEHSSLSSAGTWEERLADIYRADNYGIGKLILEYLDSVKPGYKEDYLRQNQFEASQNRAKEKFSDIFRKFEGELELSQSYGQIDISKKEDILLAANRYRVEALETGNFGFVQNILQQYLNFVKMEAAKKGEVPKQRLAECEARYQDSTDENVKGALEIIRKRIASQNYTAAEDMLGRLENGRVNLSEMTFRNDELNKFISDFYLHYSKVKGSGVSLKSLLPAMPERNKDSKAANILRENWLVSSTDATPEKVGKLLASLGFKLAEPPTVLSKLDNVRHFDVLLQKPQNGRRNNYVHPIAVFGSLAEERKFRVACVFGNYSDDKLMNIVDKIGIAKDSIIFLECAFSLSDRRSLARQLKNRGMAKVFLVIDRVVIAYLIKNYNTTDINRMLMKISAPWAYYQPYIYSSANIMPPEMFIGRNQEIEDIEAPTGVNILYGGRQLGKSVMLQRAKNDINNDENGNRAVFVDIKDKRYPEAAEKVSRALIREGILAKGQETSDWGQLAEDIKARLQGGEEHIPYLLLLLDEADAFLDSCGEVNYRPIDNLRDVQMFGIGRFKFVIAGLRDVIRFVKGALDNNSVLTQLRARTVKPFNSTEARELLMMPLSYLGFEFEDNEVTESMIASIFSHTNYFPGLIQLYCAKLIESMQNNYAGYNEASTPPYLVNEKHIKEILAEKDLQKQIKEKFEITLNVGEDNYYKIIALLMAFKYHEGGDNTVCTAEDIRDLGAGIKKIKELNLKQVEALLEEMQELNVLRGDGNGGYRFAHMSFLQMVGDGKLENIEDDLLALMEE